MLRPSLVSLLPAKSTSTKALLPSSYDLSTPLISHPTYSKCQLFLFAMNSGVLSTVCVIGLFLNTLSFFVLHKDKNNRVAIFLLKALALSDNGVLVVALTSLSMIFGPAEIASATSFLHYIMPYMRKYINPFGNTFQSCSIWITVLIAINRFLVVCFPFSQHKLTTLCIARLQVAIVALVSLALNIPRFLLTKIEWLPAPNISTTKNHYHSGFEDGSDVWPSGTLLPVNVETPLMLNRTFYIYYFNVFYTAVILILPLLIMTGFNSAIIYSLRKSRLNRRRNSVYSTDGDQQDRSTTIVIIVIIIELLVCHSVDRMAFVIRFLYRLRGLSIYCPHPVNIMSHIGNLLVIFNCSSDFFIYVIFKRRFRSLLQQTLSCRLCGITFLKCNSQKINPSKSPRPSVCSQALLNDYEKKQFNNKLFTKPTNQDEEFDKKKGKENKELDSGNMESDKEIDRTKQEGGDFNNLRSKPSYKKYVSIEDDTDVMKTHKNEFESRCEDKEYDDFDDTSYDRNVISECNNVKVRTDENLANLSNQNKTNSSSNTCLTYKNKKWFDASQTPQSSVEDHREIASRRRSVSFALDALAKKKINFIF